MTRLGSAAGKRLRVLVYPHDLKIGGSQLNAIEIAAAIRDLGHECLVFGRPGPLVKRIRALGLEFLESPEPRRRPSPTVVNCLMTLVRDREIDVLHGYEWPPAVDAWLAASLSPRKPAAVATVMSMAVAPFLPRTMPLVVGTEQIAAQERSRRRHLTAVIEPPVDLAANRPTAPRHAEQFRRRWGLDGMTVACVTRLAHEMKLEGLLVAIDTVPTLPSPIPLQLVIVGDGPARSVVQDRATAMNRRLGRDAVVLTGEMDDPRPAYQAADILVGMGGSALKSLAFGKPLVVQGEQGFWRALTPESVDEFLWTGWYGVGRGEGFGPATLGRELAPVISDAGLRRELGRYGRELVERRFELGAAAERQIALYQAALELAPTDLRLLGDGLRSAGGYARYVARRRWQRVRGTRTADDFNSAPVVAQGPARPAAPVSEGTGG